MVNCNPGDKKIIDNILKDYPYSFYAYGSRSKEDNKNFSDLDLCIIDETVNNVVLTELKGRFEKSNLPFTVDVTLWNDMQENFQHYINKDLTLVQSNSCFKNVEDNLFSKFTYIPKILNYDVIKDKHVSIVSYDVKVAIVNIVCKTNFTKANLNNKIGKIIKDYANNPFAWWIGPSDSPFDIGMVLKEYGLEKEQNEYAMFCGMKNFKSFELDKNISIKQVKTKEQLKDFIQTLIQYDELAGIVLNNETMLSKKVIDKNPLFVSYIDGKPVGNGSLHFNKGIAGIYDIVTIDEFRNKGIGTNMMKYLMNFAYKKDIRKLSLLADSGSGRNIYSKLGFKVVGMFECYKHTGN